MNEPYPFEETIVAAALELHSAEQDDFLASLCADDAMLRRRLGLLLRLRIDPPPRLVA